MRDTLYAVVLGIIMCGYTETHKSSRTTVTSVITTYKIVFKVITHHFDMIAEILLDISGYTYLQEYSSGFNGLI